MNIPVQMGSLHGALNNVDGIRFLALGRREVDSGRSFNSALVNIWYNSAV